MLNKRTKMKIIFGLVAATLALTVSIPDSGSISLTSSAMANEGGGGREDGMDNLFTKILKANPRGRQVSRLPSKGKKVKSSAYDVNDAIDWANKKLGGYVHVAGKPRRWICRRGPK